MKAIDPTAGTGPGKSTWPYRLLRLAVLLLFCYVGVIIVLLFFENWMVYYPTKASSHWQDKPSEEVKDVEVTAADGTTIHAWWWPQAGARGAILYCHGNAGNLSHRAGSIAALHQFFKESVLIFDYPGYGKSGGKPSEAGCYAAADAVYDWLVSKQNVDPDRILIYGGSLGGGVAIELAHRKKKCRGLLLANTFSTLPDVGQAHYPWLPVRWLMRNRFDNLAKIGQLHQPVFIGHATGDNLIPFALGKKLFDAANPPKEFFSLDGADHNDGLPGEFFSRAKAFLEACERSRPGGKK